MREAVTQTHAAAPDEDRCGVCPHRLLFHRHIVQLLGSPLFDAFFTTILAQLRLVFASAPDERRFQGLWIAKDRHILEPIDNGRNDEASVALADYPRQSEHALLDYL
jgi:DNA-binding FadR family transcriptional regulator